MLHPRKIYLLDPRHLSPETIAVAFAKTSRSPLTFQEIADELSDEKSADFHEKWVVGYGHSSVAEHAVLHIALENVSRLSIECVESNRLASYTEKSSRYQIWDRNSFFIPPELTKHSLKKEYIKHNQQLFDHYQYTLDKTSDYLKITQPQKKNESDRAFSQRIRTSSADACRYYLPSCALANVGMTINARALEHAIVKLLSHPLREVNSIGSEIKSASQKIVPTLVKYAEENEYLKTCDNFLSQVEIIEKPTIPESNDWLNCISCDSEGETLILAALLFRFGEMPMDVAIKLIDSLSQEQREEIGFHLLGKLGNHDIPLREMEYASIGFDMLLDQGAYFELKRHRMMTQTPQALTARRGYAVPTLLDEAGISQMFVDDMDKSAVIFEKLYDVDPHLSSYIVPNAYNRRVLIQMNLRSAFHFIKIRSAPNAHFAIRRIALRIAEEICLRYPLFAKYFKPEDNESWQSITSSYFRRLF